MAFMWGQFRKRCLNHKSLKYCLKLHTWNLGIEYVSLMPCLHTTLKLRDAPLKQMHRGCWKWKHMANIDHTQGTNDICDDISYPHKYHILVSNNIKMFMIMFIIICNTNNSTILLGVCSYYTHGISYSVAGNMFYLNTLYCHFPTCSP